MDNRIDKQEHTIQQVQGEVLQIQSDVQVVFDQMNELSFKFSTMFAEWQQQRGHNQPSSFTQNRGDQDRVATSKG